MSDNEETFTIEDVFTDWIGGWVIYPRPCDLPDAPNADGRPVWEPPILDYSKYIGEEYAKKRKAMLKYTGGDVARTTDIMDVDTEQCLLWEYRGWALDNTGSAVDNESRKFFVGLYEQVNLDWGDVCTKWISFDGGLLYLPNEDGTYRVMNSSTWASSVDGLKSDESTHISHNAINPSASPSLSCNSESNNTNDTMHEQVTARHNLILEIQDEAEKFAWLDSPDTATSATSPPITIITQPRDTTPLALRLLSLHSHAVSSQGQTGDKHMVPDIEDDVD